MKKTLLMLAALLCCCFALKAQDFTYNGLNYRVTGTNPPTVTLTGHAEGFTAHDLVIPSTVEDNDGTSYSVTSIGNYAFEGCSGFTGSLTIGSSVTSIGNYAFKGCSGFTGSLIIPNSVTSIGDNAYSGCSGFTGSLTIGNSVERIGERAFLHCSGFNGSLNIGGSVTSIGDNAFYECSGFTGDLIIPNSVEFIGNSAFYKCSGFTGSLNIPNSVTSIEGSAFERCSGFTGSLTIPNSVTSIGVSAFERCSGFTGSLTIGSSVTSIGEAAFYECSGFTGSLNIPNSVTSIGNSAFNKCSSFAGSLTIPNSVTSIGNHAFYECSGFTGTLTIGNSVVSIGELAFEDTGLAIIIAKPATPPTLGGYYIWQVQSITVPCGSAEDYKSEAVWSDFKDKIRDSILYDLTVTSANPNFGSANITQIATCENDAQVTAIPVEGCLFTGWTENGVEVSTANPYTFTLTADRNLVANFSRSYDFSAICQTGQRLCYRIIDAEQHWVKIVAPNGDNANGWNGFAKPTGDITLPETVEHNGTSYTVKAIGDCSFYSCDGLTGSLTIPNSVTSIEGSAFERCSGFTGSLTIPNSVTSIGVSAFERCSGFTGSLTIGSSVTSIRNYAFGRTHFAQIIAKPTTPPAIYYYFAFSLMQELQSIFVPCGSVDAYKSNWNDFADKIKGGSFEHELTVASARPEIGTASITQYSDCTSGLSTVTATPAGINRFTGWTENGVVVSTDNPYSFTLTSDRNLVANFVECVNVYEPVMSMPSPINYDAVYVLGYQDGDDYYLHTSGTAAGEMRLTKNPESPIKYSFTQMPLVASIPILSVLNEQNFFAINSAGVFLTTTFDIFNDPYKYYISIQAGDISSQSAPTYTAYHDGDTIRSHENSSEGNLRLFEITTKPLYHIAVSSTPEGLGTATATCGGETVESALEGTNITVSATPNEGCKFVNWTENDEVVSTANPYTFTLNSDRNLVANFFRQYDFSADCSTGQTLYYRIIDAEQHLVSIVAPNNDDNYLCWNNFTKPTGSIELPETVEHDGTSYTVAEINSYAFYRCDGLTGSLTIPNSVISIGNDAFYNCTGFNGSLTIGNAVTNIGNNAFNQCSSFTGSLDIPNSVTSIGNNAFKKCEGFTGSLTIGNSVTGIGQQAFENCSGFNGSLTIGNAVTSIGATAFNGCTNFTGTLTIGSSVTSIGNYAFFNCSGFTHIIAKPATPPTLGTDVFDSMSELQFITVPCGKENDYKDSWSVVADKIDDGFVHDLTVTSSNPDFGMASITQQATCENPQATVSATPNPSYIFTGWTENGVEVSNTTTYTFTMTGDRNLVANFAAKPTYNITVSANSTDAGTVTATCGGEPVESAIEGTSITVSATPNDGYKFVNWTENGDVVSSNNPYTFELTSDRNLVANFTITDQYDFTAICATGQKLYYRIIDAEQHWVSIVPPNSDNAWECYKGYAKPIGNISLPETVSHNDISYTVKAIGGCAFFDCYGLTGSLTIPNSVTSIGEGAFVECSGFTGSLNIPDNVTSIGESAFGACSGFTGSLTIGTSVENIGFGAFYGCSGFTGSLTIPNSVTSIGEGAFMLCSGFTGSLTIPNSVESIGGEAFADCSGFTGSLTIPNSVKSIGESAFEACSGFTGSLTIPSSVTSIGDYAFADCSGFTGSLTIGSSLRSIEGCAFEECDNFSNIISKAQNAPSLTCSIPCTSKNVYIPKNTTSLYESAWGGYGYTFIEYDREDYHFNGTNGSEWNTAANWAENEVPTQSSPTVFINADCQVNTNAEVGAIIVAAGKTLTVNQGFTLTPDGVTLENGAQLMNNGTVTCNDLTVKKDITGYGTGTGGWYLVSSPVGTIGIPSSMRTNPKENYDLYRFEQNGADGNEWINAKFVESQHIDFYLEDLSGYLYANKNNTTIVFHGNFAATATKQLQYVEGVDFPGFNLVGNPYPCNATISGTNLRSSNYYYKMNAGGTALEVVANPVIAPCTGVFAVAANSNATVTFTRTSDAATVTRGEKNALRDVRVELTANGKVIDRAILNTNGESLPKFRLNDNSSEICFYQNKEELAVASTGSARGEMPLNFKAAKNGSYTITVNVENADLNYLHLVDNLTGADVDLLATASTGSANYTFDAKTSDYASRFKLVFGVKDETSEASENFAFISNGEIIVSNEGRATLQVIDVMGRIVSSEEINGEARISTNGMTAGLYILNLNGKTQKIVVK